MVRSYLSALALLGLASLLPGCGSSVDGGEGGDGQRSAGEGGGPDSTSGSTGVGMSSSTTTGPGGQDSGLVDALAEEAFGRAWLGITSTPRQSCDLDVGIDWQCEPFEQFQLHVEMPHERLVAGEVVTFTDPEVVTGITRLSSTTSPGGCTLMGTNVLTVVIGDVRDDAVTVLVDEAQLASDGIAGVDRAFEVPRCRPSEPSPRPPHVAYWVSSWDGGRPGAGGDRFGPGSPPEESFTTVGGGGPGTRSAIIFQLTDHDAATCTAPNAMPACPAAARTVSIGLDAEQAIAGAVFRLDDPYVLVSFVDQSPIEGEEGCNVESGGEPLPGTIEILTAHPFGFRVSVEGTGDPELDGEYDVAYCY